MISGVYIILMLFLSATHCHVHVHTVPVLIIYQSIIEDTIDLVHPQSDELVSLIHMSVRDKKDSSHHTSKVS